MSTRCQIGIYSKPWNPFRQRKTFKKAIREYDVMLYRHWDGMPDRIIPDIKPFLEDFAIKRGIDDAEYCGAWLMHHMIQQSIERARMLDQQLGTTSQENFLRYNGYGIYKGFFQWDIEYYYAIYPRYIRIYRTNCSEDHDKWHYLQTVYLDAFLPKQLSLPGV